MLEVPRRYDVLGRYGGEEFLMLLPGCDQLAAAQVAERLRESVAAEPIGVGPVRLPVTLSVGWPACLPTATSRQISFKRPTRRSIGLKRWAGIA